MDLLATQKSFQKVWKRIGKHGWKWFKVIESGWTWVKVDECEFMWINVVENYWKWLNLVESGWKWMKISAMLQASLMPLFWLIEPPQQWQGHVSERPKWVGGLEWCIWSGGPCCSCCQVEHKYWDEVGVFNQLLMIDMHYIQFNIKYVLFKIVNQSNEYISYWPWFIWGTQALLLPINWNWGKEEVNIGFVDTEKLITQSAKQRSWSIWRPGSTVHSYWGNTGVGC